MARKITQRTPVIEIAVFPPKRRVGPTEWDERGAEDALRDALAALKASVPRLLSDYSVEIDWKIETESQCEFCRSRWTEKSMAYNGGCCDADEANNPAAQEAA